MSMPITCSDGYVIGTDNKFVTSEDDPFYIYYRYYWDTYGREAAKNHKQMVEIVNRLGTFQIGLICDEMTVLV